ncbi:hypothetical protein ONZ45_g15743 [Pleurotus djamor]|nr:hypothetical protein ONZ45_g15743 [Pleurotus djamor]
MAGLEALASLIYHEKQQSGSMLCAQHALNSLLQGNYFSAPDLSDIARNLDTLESSYREQDDPRGSTSANMDDTVAKTQSLSTQLAFILNYEQHWFTLRRFGPAMTHPDEDPGEGHWFNLNSFLPSPEWVGKLYLGLLLQQAEADGYSVFAVVQVDPSAPLAIPRTEADQIAATLPEPTETPNYSSSRSYSTKPTSSNQASVGGSSIRDEEFEDEDFELQAALQASLMDGDTAYIPSSPPPITRTSVPLPPSGPSSAPGSGSMTPQSRQPPIWGQAVHPPHPTGDADLDPVAASFERQRVRLQRMREQQEFAQRELWDGMGFGAEGPPRRDDDDDDDENLRKAIAESEAMARAEGHGRSEEDEEDDTHPNPYPSTSHGAGARVYDDEDAELQAALKASLEGVPAGWTAPELSNPPSQTRRAPEVHEPHATDSSDYSMETDSMVTDDTESVVSEASVSQPTPTPVLDAEEIRRKRLARFGS